MIRLLLLALSKYPHVTKSATSALVALGEAISSNGSIEEFGILLHGAIVDQSHIRLAVLQSLQVSTFCDVCSPSLSTI